MKRIILLLTAFALLPGCQHDKDRLDQIESVLWTQPDSALAMLQEDSVLAKSYSLKDFARYSLLMSAALDKNYIDVRSDSIIRYAVDYYADKKKSKYQYLANYYHGLVLKNMGAYPAAVVALEKAGNDALSCEDYLYAGLSLRNKAVIFTLMGNSVAAIECQQQAICSFKKIQDKRYLHYSMFGLATEYLNNQDLPNAKKVLTQLDTISLNLSLRHQCNLRLASVLAREGGQSERVIKLYNSVPEKYFDVIDYGNLALAYERVGKKDSSDMWRQAGYRKACDWTEEGTIDYMSSRIEALRHHYPEAYRLQSIATHVQDSLTRIRLKESANAALQDYYSQELQVQQQKTKTKTVRYQAGMAILALIIALVISLSISAVRKRDDKYRELLAGIHSNDNSIRQLVKDNANLFGSALSGKLLYLDELSAEFSNADSEKAKDAVYKKYKEAVQQLKDNPDLFDDIEQSLDRYCDGVIARFKSQFPDIKGDKLRLALLFFTGIPYKTAQLLFRNHSVDSMKTARRRLRQMIQESNAPDASLFLEMLEMKKGGRRPKQNDY